MECNRDFFSFNSSSSLKILLVSFFLLIGASTSSTSISDEIFASDPSIGRNLLQETKPCPIDFENRDYNIITSNCKPPDYQVESCCSSFKKFACEFVVFLNDLQNDCAFVMFGYINLHGSYPPGLFASECRDGKQGLECPTPP